MADTSTSAPIPITQVGVVATTGHTYFALGGAAVGAAVGFGISYFLKLKDKKHGTVITIGLCVALAAGTGYYAYENFYGVSTGSVSN